MSIKKELDKLAKQQAALAAMQERLSAELKAEEARDAKLDALYEKSGFDSPKDLVKALIARFEVRLGGGRPKGSGKKAAAAPVTTRKRAAKKAAKKRAAKKSARKSAGAPRKAARTGKRKRTKVTAELRDQIKRDLAAGKSMNSLKKVYDVSYAVVVKVNKGAYNNLK